MALIERKQMLDKNHVPVVVVFHGLYGKLFINAMESLSNGHGFGNDFGECSFWEDLDEYDRTRKAFFEGVEFLIYHHQDRVVIGFAEMLYYMKIACKAYCEDFPSAREKLDGYIKAYAKLKGLE